MPELPEVQTMVRDLSARIRGERVLCAWSNTPKLFRGPSYLKTAKRMKGFCVKGISRKGKYILLFLEKKNAPPHILLAHQKMTGHFLVGRWQIKGKRVISPAKGALSDPFNRHIRVLWTFYSGKMLALCDQRKFATLRFGEEGRILSLPEISKLGPDVLSRAFSPSYFFQALMGKKVPIKTVLLNQEIVSGVGNIYADEALFMSRLHPARPAGSFTMREIVALVGAVKKVLKKSLKLRGASVGEFRDTFGKKGYYQKHRLVYGKKDDDCPRCGSAIRAMKVRGRSSHFCPKCQKTGNKQNVKTAG